MNDLFDREIEIRTPALVEIEGIIGKCKFEKFRRLETEEQVRISTFPLRANSGFKITLADVGSTIILPKNTAAELDGHALIVADGMATEADLVADGAVSSMRWFRPKPSKITNLDLKAVNGVCNKVRLSWKGAFFFNEEIRGEDGQILKAGLRPPQVGALHATLAHWSVTDRPATIVMPTGTGKTETMLALLTAVGINRLLVVVPNAALRDQIANKFKTLGILKAASVLKESAEMPLVAVLEGRPTSSEEVVEIFSRANVIITTMQVAGQCDPAVQEKMAELSSHLFIDEAHHIAARTWQLFKAKFRDRTVVQFTATPFRTDGKRVDGKFIYVYPLAKAQKEGYFRPINFQAVQGLQEKEADKEIVKRVGTQLRSDIHDGLDHLVMARAKSITRAKEIVALYNDELGEFRPVLIHSQMKKSLKDEALARLRSRKSRIIVCVDMLGEGFDLPQLKISGLHDKHKSVAITLQFTGRFTRDSKGIGEATVIANIEQSEIDESLRSLYAEDADWNFLLNVLNENRTGRQLKRAAIMDGFGDSLEGIPLQTLQPKMNTIVYRTECNEWNPQEIERALPFASVQAGPVINDEERIAIFVTREDIPVRWSSTKEVTNVEWNLFMVHWDSETKLLYINSSKSKELHERLAQSVCGEQVSRIMGEHVYRVLDGMSRLMLMNLGLSSTLGRQVRYTMFVGSDITSQISDQQFSTKRKSNIFGVGYEGDGKVNIGCSAKGKFWSMQSATDFSEWLEWCRSIGKKITDNSIKTDSFVRNLVKQTQISERPKNKPVLAVHWPESFLIDIEERMSVCFGDSDWIGFFECEIETQNYDSEGPIRFTVSTDEYESTFEVSLSAEKAEYIQVDGPPVMFKKGAERPLSEVFADDPPHIYFADGDFLIFNELFSLPIHDDRQAFDISKIETRDWDGVDIKTESQGHEKKAESIQRKIIETLLASDEGYEVIFDDDGTGEIADIVALRETDNGLHVDLWPPRTIPISG
jgi:superfamily II DNA or RNA helicase